MESKLERLEKKEDKIVTVVGAYQPTIDYLTDCFRYRDLFLFLSLRDVQVRYKQAFFGVSWALIRPILNMLLFTVIFGALASLPSQNVNYSLFVLAGILPWQLFVNYISEGSASLVNNSNLITKLYFPRILIPLAGLLVNLIDFGVGILLLTIMMIFTGDGQLSSFFLVAPFIVMTLFLCVGTSFWLSAMTVRYRDFKFIIPLIMQFGMFISPVAYDSDLISSSWFWLYSLNPMVGIINGFRFAFFGIVAHGLVNSIITSALISIGILVSGLLFFRNMEKHFADQI